MMLTDRFNQDNFDEVLERALQRHSEPVPADFTERMLRRIKEAEQQKVLARVILQERLSLAGSIVLGSAVLVLMTIFSGTVTAFLKSIAVSLTAEGQAFMEEIPRTVGVVRGDWQFYAVFVVVFLFIVYGLVDLLAANSE